MLLHFLFIALYYLINPHQFDYKIQQGIKFIRQQYNRSSSLLHAF